ncbi:MAG: UDP-N-acetylmuramate--L-alanine ligase [Rikenellaceae bacterium]
MGSEATNKSIYFVGIGGIGMSALARYFLHEGRKVGGYDKTSTVLTQALEREGAAVHYDDSVAMIPEEFKDPATTVVIYTPAIPANHTEMKFFEEGGFEILKRSQMLGVLTEGKYVMAVAGTHGKSSTSTMVSWFNSETEGEEGRGCAILGAISKNFESNLVLGGGDRVVVEADEYDRSFLRLAPDVAVVTSVDPDHLDIYGTYDAVKEAFAQFVDRIKKGGSLILKREVMAEQKVEIRNGAISVYSYSADEDDSQSDFHIENLELLRNGHYRFDIIMPEGGRIDRCTLGVLGRVNVENCVAAVASMWCAAKRDGKELDIERLKGAIESFSGVKRRWEIYHSSQSGLYMDDYAHHPREIGATLSSLREILQGRHLTAIFQPHLYSRTNDLYKEFAESLSIADRVILLPIYPAREEPMEGVSSQMIAELVTTNKAPEIVPRMEIAEHLKGLEPLDVVVTIGAGDIDLHCAEIAEIVATNAAKMEAKKE